MATPNATRNPGLALFVGALVSCAIAIALWTGRGPQADPSSPRGGDAPPVEKPTLEDTLTANMYADNWFEMYVNGELVCVDSIRFMPHNVISVDLLPSYPMTIAVMAKDNADAKTGMEYGNTSIGDGGFVLKFSDGTVSSSAWKAKRVSWGPLNGDAANPRTVHVEIPQGWYAPDFDDREWPDAKEFSEAEVRPKEPFYDHDFEGAAFIWSGDLKLDNTVLFRHTVESPPDGSHPRTFSGLENPNGNEPEVRSPSSEHAGVDESAASAVASVGSALPPDAPEVARAFARFDPEARLRWDDDYLYVESDGVPDHPMMIGITAWQQQVPLPQAYTGSNAWQIPLNPTPAQEPLSAKTNFFRGAIALAVNGVPIFNPIKNDGLTDTLLAGELDQWGGHCGRADDYHYHVAPVHLAQVVGEGQPIAYALDGYPLLGGQEPGASETGELDWLNGHEDHHGNYHYHTTESYPYVNGGFFGAVTERDGQVEPQPRAQPIRPHLPPLPGARITGFTSTKSNEYRLTYELQGKTGRVDYTITDGGEVTFTTVDVSGHTETMTYDPNPDDAPGNPYTAIAAAIAAAISLVLAALGGASFWRRRRRLAEASA